MPKTHSSRDPRGGGGEYQPTWHDGRVSCGTSYPENFTALLQPRGSQTSQQPGRFGSMETWQQKLKASFFSNLEGDLIRYRGSKEKKGNKNLRELYVIRKLYPEFNCYIQYVARYDHHCALIKRAVCRSTFPNLRQQQTNSHHGNGQKKKNNGCLF